MSLLLFFLSLFIGISIRYSLVAGIVELLALFLFILVKYKKKKLLIPFVAFSALGVGLSFIRPSYTRNELTGVVISVKDNYFLLSSKLERLYISEKGHSYEVGDILHIYGEKKELSFTHLESEFDFEQYLNNKGVFIEFIPNKIEVKFSCPLKINKIKKEFLSNFNNEAASIISAILFSDSIKSESSDLVKELHLVRLLSVSGIYLFFIYSLFEKLLSIFIKKKKIVHLILVVFFLPHLVFTFPRFVVIKFIFLRLIKWINDYHLKKKFTYLELLSLSGIIFLLINPYWATQESFVLSYLIPIIFIIINNSFRFKKRWIKNAFNIGVIFLALIPYEAKFYSEIMPLSVLLQLVITPAFLFLHVLSVISFIKIPIYSFINSYCYFINKTLTFLRPIFFSVYTLPFSEFTTFIYETLLLIIIYYGSIRLKPLFRIFVTAIIPIGLFHLIPIKRLVFPFVSFINVGQGDATLISYKNTNVLIDTGGNKYKDIATNVLIPYFKSKQIYDIDLLITTHDDYDHSGAASSLIEHFTVNQYVKNPEMFPITIGPLTFTNYNVYSDLWSDENNRSLVVGFEVAKYKYLLMGDASKSIEHAIVKNKVKIECDVLKVGHHGSNTSTSEEFINYLKPKYAIISCGYKNSYGHPHKEIIAILKKYNVTIRRTDLEGTITF